MTAEHEGWPAELGAQFGACPGVNGHDAAEDDAAEDDGRAGSAAASSGDRLEVGPDEIDRAIEAIVLVAEEPIEARLMAQLLEIPVAEVEQRCRGLAAQYADQRRGFELVRVAGGYRYQTTPDLAAYVERYVLDGQAAKLSLAALETLAIVAYKQPISRAQVAAIRGVNVDGVMRTLGQRGLVAETGRDPGPGQAVLYGTTRLFLERLGLDRVEDLPSVGDFVPGGDVVEALERTLLADGDPRRRQRPPAETSGEDGEDAEGAEDGTAGADPGPG